MIVYDAVVLGTALGFGVVVLGWVRRTPTAVLLVPFLLNAAYQGVSLFYLEHGSIYLHELDVTSGLNGATLSFLLYHVVFVLGVFLAVGREGTSSAPAPTVRWPAASWWSCVLFASAVLMAVYAHLLTSAGIPLFDPYISKQRFWAEYARYPELRSLLGTTSSYVPFVLGVAWVAAKGKDAQPRRVAIAVLLVCYVGYVVLLGHKFGAIYYAGVYFGLPSAYARLRDGRPLLRRREAVAAGLLASSVVLFIVFQYANHPLVKEVGSPWALLFYRVFALTGQIWWRAHGYVFAGGDTASANVGALADGLRYVMRLFASTYSDVEVAIERGSNFSDASPAIALLVLGPALLVAHQAATGLLWGWLSRVVRWQLEHGSVLELVIAFQLFGWYFNTITMGSYSVFFNLRNMMLLALLGMAYLARTARTRSITVAPAEAT